MHSFLQRILITLFVLAMSTACFGPSKAERTNGGRAAYGNPTTFSSHAKKNRKAKKNALKEARKKKRLQSKEPYRLLPM